MSRRRSDDRPEEVDEETSAEPRPSRSQKSRDSKAVTELALEMIELKGPDLDLLELDDDLRQAIDVCQGLGLRARSRQNRLVAQLLRASDHEAIRVRITKLRSLRVTGSSRDRAAKAWVERLIESGDEALQAFVEAYPVADRSRMRGLIRNAAGDPESKKARRARSALLDAVRAASG